MSFGKINFGYRIQFPPQQMSDWFKLLSDHSLHYSLP